MQRKIDIFKFNFGKNNLHHQSAHKKLPHISVSNYYM